MVKSYMRIVKSFSSKHWKVKAAQRNAFHRGSDVEAMIRDFDRILTSNRTSYQIDSGNVIFTHHYKGSKLRVFLNNQISK